MKYLMMSTALLCALANVSVSQNQSEKPVQQYVIVPTEHMLLVVASQPDCPLKIEDAKLLVNINSERQVKYQFNVRNKGSKLIDDFTIAAWNSYGAGGTLRAANTSGHPIEPGQSIVPFDKSSEGEIIPITSELRSKLKLEGRMKAIVVLIVEEIRFRDGSSYNDKSTSKALINFFQSSHVARN